MRYSSVCPATFLSRPNRFVAVVRRDGSDADEICHVKNTGRCRELLLPGTRVILADARNPLRKTGSDLIAVQKGDRLINMDSQAPNRVAAEYLARRYPGAEIHPESVYGDSRIDFLLTFPDGKKLYVEVKGVTLEENGETYFPDAPTLRGQKHLKALIRATREGHAAMALFVVQMERVSCVRPNDRTDPGFGEALRAAERAGVEIRAITCRVTPDELAAGPEIPVKTGNGPE